MIINLWLAVSDAAQATVLEGLRWDTESQGPYTGPLTPRQLRMFEYMQDDTVRRALFKSADVSGTTVNLWSIDFDEDKDTLLAVSDVLNGLIAQYPNQIAIVGVWKPDGAMLGTTLVLTEVPNPAYNGEPYRIPNPDFQPDLELPDFDSRAELLNPLYVPETLTERTQDGTPLYPIPTWLWMLMPDDPETGLPTASTNADLRDVNLLAGQAPRIFS